MSVHKQKGAVNLKELQENEELRKKSKEVNKKKIKVQQESK